MIEGMPRVSVGAVILNRRGEVLLQERGADAGNDQFVWSTPGGAVDPGETPQKALTRELDEELDVLVNPLVLLSANSHFALNRRGEREQWISLAHLCRIEAGTPQIMEPTKCSAFGWFSLDQARCLDLSEIAKMQLAALENRFQLDPFQLPNVYEDEVPVQSTNEVDHRTEEYGDWKVIIYRSLSYSGAIREHAVFAMGDVEDQEDVLVRVQSKCMPGTAMHSGQCDCKPQLDKSMEMIYRAGRGILVYEDFEGRGLGLTNKIRALEMKNLGYDTLAAPRKIGLPDELRTFYVSAGLIRSRKPRSVILLGSSTEKRNALSAYGVNITNLCKLDIALPLDTARHVQAKEERFAKNGRDPFADFYELLTRSPD